jgi:hypothetical protein
LTTVKIDSETAKLKMSNLVASRHMPKEKIREKHPGRKLQDPVLPKSCLVLLHKPSGRTSAAHRKVGTNFCAHLETVLNCEQRLLYKPWPLGKHVLSVENARIAIGPSGVHSQ